MLTRFVVSLLIGLATGAGMFYLLWWLYRAVHWWLL